ncbi:hypothetical protein V6Z12_D06G131800 [Gossypium hirsutum]|uniref:Uncharacterized protein n=1 Tax=Gossypium tomentosum TaxID=34277 RepID=A0A5D2KKY1_GOSTO|nr:hypothetical protein ES332_D06G143300v1 [Gossypium tomentosum]
MDIDLVPSQRLEFWWSHNSFGAFSLFSNA